MTKSRKREDITAIAKTLKLPEIPYGADIDLENKGGMGEEKPWYRVTDPKSKLIRGACMTPESSLNYYFFCLWLILPPPARSLDAVNELVERQIGRKVKEALLKRIRRTYAWDVRTTAYDDFLMTNRLEDNQKAVEKMNDYYAAISRKLIDSYMIPYQALSEKIQKDPKFIQELVDKPPLVLLNAMNSFTRSITELMKMERLARGVSTSNSATHKKVDINVTVDDFTSKLQSVEDRLAKEVKEEA